MIWCIIKLVNVSFLIWSQNAIQFCEKTGSKSLTACFIQGDSGGMVNTLVSDSIAQSEKKKVYMNKCINLDGYRDRAFTIWLAVFFPPSSLTRWMKSELSDNKG
jgi:hypothetical protein